MVVPVKWVFPIISIGKALLAVDLWINALVREKKRELKLKKEEKRQNEYMWHNQRLIQTEKGVGRKT